MHNLKSKKKTIEWARIVETFCQTLKHFWFSFFFQRKCNTFGATPKGNVLFAKGLQFQAREVCRGGRSTAIHLSEQAQRNATQPKSAALWAESPAASCPSLPALRQCQLLCSSLGRDSTARAGCCSCHCPLQHPHLGQSHLVSRQWENLSTPGNEWKLCFIWVLHPFLLQTPCQSLVVLDSPHNCSKYTISSACQVYFQWFSGAVFYCFVYCFFSMHCSFAEVLEALLHH